jgi:hypothetical protein
MMENVTVYTTQAVEQTIRGRAKAGQWYVLRFNGFTFKIYGRWAQVMETPTGLRDSGVMGHKSARALSAEVLHFIEANSEQTA